MMGQSQIYFKWKNVLNMLISAREQIYDFIFIIPGKLHHSSKMILFIPLR